MFVHILRLGPSQWSSAGRVALSTDKPWRVCWLPPSRLLSNTHALRCPCQRDVPFIPLAHIRASGLYVAFPARPAPTCMTSPTKRAHAAKWCSIRWCAT